MKVVILAGGFGTRLSEETQSIPKPMVEIGGKPILWHIMKIYSYYGFNDFIICLGYKGHIIKEYFKNYFLHNSDVTFNMEDNSMNIHSNRSEPWKVTLIETGLKTMTGGRIKRIEQYIQEDSFFVTYSDGVGDVDINELLNYHKQKGTIGTLTGVALRSQFGVLDIEDGLVKAFKEKPIIEDLTINTGFFVFNKEIFNYLKGDDCILEQEPLEKLTSEDELAVYKHKGFWACMDTQKDVDYLSEIGRAHV